MGRWPGTVRPGAAGLAAPDPGRTGQPARRRYLGPGSRRPGPPARLPDRDRPPLACHTIARDHPRLGRSLPHPARRVPGRIARTGPHRRGLERSPRRRFPAGAPAGRTGPGTTGTQRSVHLLVDTRRTRLDLRMDRAARTRDRPRPGVRPRSRRTGIEFFVGFSLAGEATAWTWAGDYAAARQPAMDAVEIARRVRNPALSALASFAAADAIWRTEPHAALPLIEDSLTLLRAGAADTILGRPGTARPGAAGLAAPDPGRTGQPAGRHHLGPGPGRPGTPARLPHRDRPSPRCGI
jgi:hypothetical protein